MVRSILMKLFMREHVLLIVVQVIQILLITGILWLAGFRDLRLILYIIFLHAFLLTCYLFYYYWSRRQFYRRLQTPIHSLDDALEKLDNRPISDSLDQLLRSQYAIYQEQIMQLKKKQD